MAVRMGYAKSFAAIFALGLGLLTGFDAEAGGGRRAASGKLVELNFLFAAPDDGAIVLVAAPEIGATEMRFNNQAVVVPVAGKFLKSRGPFGVAAGTDKLLVSMGERVADIDASFFVTALFVPSDREAAPYVIAAPKWVHFLSRGEFFVPDQEDSPGLTMPGGGVRVLAGSSSDRETFGVPARRNRRGR